MSSLYELAKLYGTDKLNNGYISHYERHFESIRLKVRSLLELGVLSGASLKMWKEYFPNATIYGVDIDPRSQKSQSDRINITTCPQDDEASLMRIVAASQGSFDIVIDDASHINKLTLKSFSILSPFTNLFYVVEDMLCSYLHDMSKFKDCLPGLSLIVDLQEGDWKNDRTDIDSFLSNEIDKLDDSRSTWKAIHLYSMVYFFERDRIV